MVQKIISFFGRDIESIHQAAYILAGATFIGQLLGLFRDRLLASTFGAGSLLDVYYAAFRLQDIIYVTVGSILSAIILIPLFSEVEEKEGCDKLRKVINSIFTIGFTFLLIVSVLGFLFAPVLAAVFFPGITLEYRPLLIDLMRLLLLSPFLFSLSGILSSIVQLYNRFTITSFAPILYNLGIIIGIVALYPYFGMKGVVYGVLLGAILHTAIHLPYVAKIRLLPRFTKDVDWGSIRSTIRLALQRGVGLGSQYLGLLFLTGLATTIGVGSVAVMTFAQNLQGMVLGLIGLSYAVATFPTLSRVYAEGNLVEFSQKMNATLRHIIFWSLPAIALVIVLRAYIVRAVLGSGIFDWQATILTSASLAIFSIAILLQGIVMLVFRALYASNRNMSVMIIAVLSEVVTIGIAYYGLSLYDSSAFFRDFIENLFRIDGVEGGAILMIPIAFVIGHLLKSLLGLLYLKRSLKIVYEGVFKTFAHSFAGASAIALVTYQFLDYFSSIFGVTTFLGVFVSGAISGLLGLLMGVFILYILKNNEFFEIVSALRRKLRPEEIVSVQEMGQ